MIIETKSNGKSEIKKDKVFTTIVDSYETIKSNSFDDLIDKMDRIVLEADSNITDGALRNCHGDWYEWLIAITAWNYRIENNKNKLLLLLPNVSRFDVATLYQPKIYSYINDLRAKLNDSQNVELISSNPDFVSIDSKDIELNNEEINFSEPIVEITSATIDKLNNAYSFFKDKCNFNQIVSYLSVKTSLRPDRRLQIAHEGSLLKAIYVHIQTREWIINPKGLKYYAASQIINDSDRKALNTVATHSITNVSSIPQSAVDDVFEMANYSSAVDAIQTIIDE